MRRRVQSLPDVSGVIGLRRMKIDSSHPECQTFRSRTSCPLSSLSMFCVPSRCWMKDNHRAWLAHYFTNMTVLFILVSSGIVMLFLVYREIRTRDEWRQNRVAFLSIWGLSCLFGTTWGLTFLDFGPLSTFILFLSCILNSFQGLCSCYVLPS